MLSRLFVKAMHSGRSPYLEIWAYFETNYPHGNINYV